MKKTIKSLLLLPLLILSSCGNPSHPIVGNKFTLSNEAPITTYAQGYDEESYLELLNNASALETYGSIDDVITLPFRDSICEEGFINVSDMLIYDKYYMCYGTESNQVVSCFLIPNDDKGIDSTNFRFAKYDSFKDEEIKYIIKSSSSSFDSLYVGFEVIAESFIKKDDKYLATVKAKYYNHSSKIDSIDATFVFTFTK